MSWCAILSNAFSGFTKLQIQYVSTKSLVTIFTCFFCEVTSLVTDSEADDFSPKEWRHLSIIPANDHVTYTDHMTNILAGWNTEAGGEVGEKLKNKGAIIYNNFDFYLSICVLLCCAKQSVGVWFSILSCDFVMIMLLDLALGEPRNVTTVQTVSQSPTTGRLFILACRFGQTQRQSNTSNTDRRLLRLRNKINRQRSRLRACFYQSKVDKIGESNSRHLREFTASCKVVPLGRATFWMLKLVNFHRCPCCPCDIKVP